MFDSLNFKLLGLCVVLLAAGYICLGQGPVNNPLSLTVAPVILVAVYCFLIPFAIIAHKKDAKNKED